jgi:sortase A
MIITEQKHAEKENFMKRKLSILLIVLIFVAGIGIMSYPLVSSAINNYVSRSSVKEYTNKVAQMPSEKTQKMFEEATKYNNSLSNNMIITDPFDEKAFQKIGERYEHTLSVDEDGLIGYIDIPKINVYLPIYHGTSEEILSKGAGHLQNTSLPVGGKSTHAVISAHSGYPGETFFDYLTDMKVGDEFYVHILDRTLKYEVDQIEVVLPSEINSLRIVDGEDLVTLLTCTPYGVNTHRLLMRGKHVAYDDTKYVETGVSLAKFDNGYIFFLGYKIPYAVAAGIIVGFVALVVFVVIFLLKRKKKKSVGAKRLKADSADENQNDSGGDADA